MFKDAHRLWRWEDGYGEVYVVAIDRQSAMERMGHVLDVHGVDEWDADELAAVHPDVVVTVPWWADPRHEIECLSPSERGGTFTEDTAKAWAQALTLEQSIYSRQ